VAGHFPRLHAVGIGERLRRNLLLGPTVPSLYNIEQFSLTEARDQARASTTALAISSALHMEFAFRSILQTASWSPGASRERDFRSGPPKSTTASTPFCTLVCLVDASFRLRTLLIHAHPTFARTVRENSLGWRCCVF
jgi:hypothetical protein